MLWPFFVQNVDIFAIKQCSFVESFALSMTDLIPSDGVTRIHGTVEQFILLRRRKRGSAVAEPVRSLLEPAGAHRQRSPHPAHQGWLPHRGHSQVPTRISYHANGSACVLLVIVSDFSFRWSGSVLIISDLEHRRKGSEMNFKWKQIFS